MYQRNQVVGFHHQNKIVPFLNDENGERREDVYRRVDEEKNRDKRNERLKPKPYRCGTQIFERGKLHGFVRDGEIDPEEGQMEEAFFKRHALNYRDFDGPCHDPKRQIDPSFHKFIYITCSWIWKKGPLKTSHFIYTDGFFPV